MNTKPAFRFTLLLVAFAALLAPPAARAATITKGNSTTALNLGGSWTGGVVPGGLDIAKWDSTVTGANTVDMGAALFFGEINIANPGGLVTITNTGSFLLTLMGVNGVGIDMSVATQDLTINANLALGGWQSWNVQAGRTLTLGGTLTRNANTGIAFMGGGTFAVGAANLVNDSTGITGLWATYGSGTSIAYSTKNGTNNMVAYTGTAITDVTTASSNSTNYDYSATGTTTLTANNTANSIRNTGGASIIDLGASGTNTLTLNGLLASAGAITIQRTGGTGTLQIGTTNTLVVNGSQDVTISAPISNNSTTASSVTKYGTNTLILAGNNTFTNGVNVDGGTVRVTNLSGLGLNYAGTAATLGPGAVLDLRSNTSATFGNGGMGYNIAETNVRGTYTINVDNLTSGSGNKITVGNINTSGIDSGAVATIITGGNGYGLNMGILYNSGGPGNFTNNTPGGVNIGGLVFNSAGGGCGVVWDGTGTTTVAGSLFRFTSNVNTAQTMTKNGTGTVTLNGLRNSWGGNTIVNAGTLNLSGVIDEMSGPSGLAVNNSNTGVGTDVVLNLNSSWVVHSLASAISTPSSGNNTATINLLGTGTTLTVRSENGTNFFGTLAGTGGLTMTARNRPEQTEATLALAGKNTYTGATTLNGGSLILDFNQASVGGVVVTTNILNNTTNGSALVLGGGALTLKGKGGAYVNSQRFNGLNEVAGASTVTLTQNGATSLLLSLGAITRTTGGGTVDFVNPAGLSAVNGITTTTGNTNGILGGWATVASNDWAYNNGTNIAAYSAYTNDTWAAANNTNVTTGGALSSATTNSLRFNTAGAFTLTLTGTNTISSGGILETSAVGGNATAITGGTLLGSVGQDLVVIQNNASGALTIGSVIANNTSATGLTKSGAGNLTLTGANTYTGATNINGGVLQISASNGIGDNTAATNKIVFNSNGVLGGTGGILESTAGTYDLGVNRTITLNGPGTIQVDSGSTVTASGVVSGAGVFTKSGTGKLILTGTNTFSSTSLVTAGILNIQNNSALGIFQYGSGYNTGTSAVSQIDTIVSSGATLQFQGGISLDAKRVTLSGTGASGQNGALVNVSGYNTIGGYQGFSNGTFIYLAANTTISSDAGYFGTSSAFGLSSGAFTLTLTGSGNGYLASQNIGGGITALTKNGTGMWTPGASGSSWIGVTTINAGILNGITLANGGSNSSIGKSTNAAANLVFGGNSTLRLYASTTDRNFTINNGVTATFDTQAAVTISGSAVASTGGLTKFGGSTLTLSGTNLYTGATTVNAGSLILDFNGTGAPTSNIISSSSSLTLAGGTLTLNGKSALTLSQTFNGLTLNSGGSVFTLTQNSATSLTGALGGITRNAGSTLNFSVVPLTTGVIATTTTTNDATGILGTWATTGTGTSLRYATQNATTNQIGAYSGGTTAASSANLTDTTGTVNYDLTLATGTMNATVSANTIRYAGSGNTTTLGSSFTVNGLMYAGTGPNWTITSGNLTIGANKELVVLGNGQSVIINSVIQDNGGGNSSLTYTSGQSNAPMTLGGANTYSGPTYVNNGILQINAANNLGNSTSIYLNNATLTSTANTYDLGNTRTIFLGGNGDTISSSAGTLTVSGPVDNGGNGLLTVAGAGNTTISGVIGNASGTGNGGLTMSGTGTLTLTNANTYRGDTTISAGTVNIQNALALGTAEGATTLGTNTTLQLQGNINVVEEALYFTPNVTGITLQNLSGNNTWSGPINLAGIPRLGVPTITANAGTTLTLAGTVNTNSNRLFVTGSGNTTITGTVGYGSVGILKSGSGTLSLQGTNNYVGQTTVSQGILAINSDAALGAAYDGSLGYMEMTGSAGSGYTGTVGVIVAAPTTTGSAALPTATTGGSQVSATLTGVNGSGYIFNPAVTFVGNGSGATANALVMGLLTIDGGTLRTDAAITSNRPVVITSNNATIDTNGFNSTFSGIVNNGATGTGSLIKTGAGALTLSGANIYAGTTTVSGGTLKAGNASALGFGGLQTTANNGTIVSSGYTLDLNGTIGINEPITISGTGIGGNGALINSGTAASIGNGIAGLAVAATGSGSGYSAAPAVVISGTGTGATATASLGVTAASISLVSGGSGWVVGDTFTVNGGGSGALFTVATVGSGAIATFNLTSAGTGYTTAPTTLTKVTSTSGTGATITGNGGNFTVGGLQMTLAGSGYTGTPTVTFNGSNATVTPALSSVTMAGNSSVGGAGDLTISAVVSESGGSRALTKVGTGILTLTGANTYTGGSTITAGTLQFANTSAMPASGTVTANSGGTLGINVGGANEFTNATSGNGSIGGIFNGGGGQVTLNSGSAVGIDTTNAGGSLTYAGDITNSGVGLAKLGAGTLVLTGTNTYTGNTTVSVGTLKVGSAAALGGNSSATSVTAGAALDLNGTTLTNTNALALNGTGVSSTGALTNSGAAASYGGVVTLGSASSIGGAGDITLALGLGTDAFTLTKVGADTLTLSADSSRTGAVAINAGTVKLGSAAALGTTAVTTSVVSGAALDINAQTVGAQALSLNGQYSSTVGALTNSGAAGSYAGTVSLLTDSSIGGAGNITLSGAISGAYGLTKVGADTLILTGATNGSTTTTINGGTLQIGSAGTSGLLGSGAVTNNGTLAFNRTDSVTVSNAIGGTGAVTVNSGTLTLGGNNTFTGGVTITAGELKLGNAGALNSTAGLQNAVAFGAGSTGTLTLNGNSTTIANLSTNASPGTTIVQNNFTGTATLTVGNSQNLSGTYAGTIQNGATGTLALTKNGTGALTLSSANTFTGGVTLNVGTLNINNASALGTTAGTFTINAGTIDNTSAAAITTSNYAQTWNGDFAFTGTKDLNLGTGVVTLGGTYGTARTITVNSGNLTVGGVINYVAGATNIIKAGNGTLTLSGVNTFGGGFTLNAGTLNINNTSALGSWGITFVINGGIIDNTSGAAITTNNTLQTWNSDFAFTGTNNLNMSAGAVTLGTALGTSRTITVNAGTLTEGGVIGNGTTANSLVKAGAGALTLAGANTFTGGVTLNAGTLNINAATALGTTAGTFTINGGTLATTLNSAGMTTSNYVQAWNGDFGYSATAPMTSGLYQGVDALGLNLGAGAVTLGGTGTTRTITTDGYYGQLTIGGIISNGATANSITKNGTGILTLSGVNAFTGGITLNAGTLQIGNAAALGTGTLTINGGSLASTASTTVSTNNAQVWNGAFSFRPITGGTLNMGTGAVTLASNSTVTAITGGLTEGGVIADGGSNYGVTWISGYGGYAPTITLNGNSTYGGATVVQSLSGLGLVSLTGTLANTSSVTVNGGGSFWSSASMNNSINTAATLTLGGNGGGMFTRGWPGTYNQSFTSLTVGSGADVLLGYYQQSNFTFSGSNPYLRGVGGVVRMNSWAGGSGFTSAPSGTGNVIGSGANAMLIGATGSTTYWSISANNFLKATSGVLTAATASSNAWGTGVNTDVLPSSWALGTVSQSLRFTAGGSLTLPGAFTVESGGILATDNTASPVTITGGTIKTGIAGSDLWIVQGAAASASTGMVINSQIIDNANSSLTKVGPRALYLTNTGNTYAGGTYLAEGILNVASEGSLGSGALHFTGPGTLQAAGNVTLGTRAVTIGQGVTATFDSNGRSISVGGVVSGVNSGLTKTGLGTLTLTGANTYTGITTVQNGTLSLDFSAIGAPVSDIINANSLLAIGAAGVSDTLIIQGAAGVANSQTFGATNSPINTVGATTFYGGMTNMVFNAGAGGSLTVNLGYIVGGSNSNSYLDVSTSGNVTVAGVNNTTNGNYLDKGFHAGGGNNYAWATINKSTWATVNTSGNLVGFADSAYTTAYTAAGLNQAMVDVTSSGTLSPTNQNAASTLRFNDTANTGAGQTVTLGSTRVSQLGSGSILVTAHAGAHDSTITGGFLAGSNMTFLGIFQNDTLGNLIINSQITDTSTQAGVYKNGAGTMILNGVNGFTNGINVLEGTVIATGNYTQSSVKTIATTLGSNVVTVSDTTGLFVGQQLYGGTPGLVVTNGMLPSVVMAIGSGNVTLSNNATATGSGISTTFQSGGALGGAGFNYANLVAPTATIANGATLQIGSAATGNSGGIDPNMSISNLGALILNHSGNYTLGNTISGAVATNSLAGTNATNTLEIAGGGNTTLGFSGTVNGSGVAAAYVYTLSTTGNVYAGQLVTGTNIAGGTYVRVVDGLNVTLTNAIQTGGASNVNFTTVNTFNGATRITGGSTLTLGSGLALQNSTLNYNNSDSGTLSFGSLTTATLGELNGDKNLALTNASSAAVALTVGGNNFDATYSGNLTGTGGSLIKNGIGTLTLTGTNNYSGGTTINANSGTLMGNLSSLQGNIAVGTSSTVVFNQPSDGTFGGNITGSGTFIKTGAGNMTISGAQGINSGVINVMEGTLTIGIGNAFLNGNAMQINGGTLNLATYEQFGTVSMSSGAITGPSFIQAFTSFNFTNSGNVTARLDNTGTLIKSGAGTVTLSAANTFTGKTSVQNGTLSFTLGNATATGAQSLGQNAALDLGVASTSSGILTYSGTGNATLAKNINVLGNGSDTIQNSTGSLLTLSGTITKNGTVLTLKGGTGGITVNGTIAGSNSGSDLVVDGGTTTLASANTYNGPTSIINGATLNANAAGALPAAIRSAVSIDPSGSGNSTLALGANQTVASLTGGITSAVHLNANTLTVGTTTGTTTFAGVISGPGGSLIKDGNSTLVLTAANTFNGTTTVSAGTLEAGVTGALGSTSAITVTNTGTLLLSANSATSNSTALTLNGGKVEIKTGTGINTSLGALTLTDNSIIDFGLSSGTDILTLGAVTSWTATKTIQIWNWTGTPRTAGGNEQLMVSSTSGWTGNLSSINFFSDSGSTLIGGGGAMFAGYELVAVPEPATWSYMAAIALGGAILVLRRRRLTEVLRIK
ncbi:MAG: autotransporter-associated beta strand repeat-containing protein [Verrucomicrobiae bacterium]